MSNELNEHQKSRRAKLATVREMGLSPYANSYHKELSLAAIKERYQGLEAKEQSAEAVTTAGRIISFRRQGKTCFLHLRDSSGKLQCYVRQDNLGEEPFMLFRKGLDVGDFIGVTGHLFYTNTGELSIKVQQAELLTKSLYPLPEKWHGLKDKEQRYRQRYVDLIANPDVMPIFIKRSQIISRIRSILESQDFMEVETPILQPMAGGATARPFVTHHNTMERDLFLRIAPELYLKRLIVGGFERVYEINKSFRNEGFSVFHNPEFTMLELYQAYADYHTMMDICQHIILTTAREIAGGLKLEWLGHTIDLTPPWTQISLYDAVEKYTGHAPSDPTLRAKLESLPENASVAQVAVAAFDKFVEHQLLNPTFITDYPIEVSPLAKLQPGSKEIVERFELIVGGRELANAYSELNDPLDQQARLEDQMAQKEAGDDEAQPLDHDFVRALEYGMPPTGGLGIGIDRLVMMLTGQNSIRDVIFFPQMRQ